MSHPAAGDDHPLVLGPLLRYVDATSATVWVRTARAASVSVRRAGRTWSAPTFGVHGSHYALVVCEGLEPGSDDPYEVLVDEEPEWPLEGAPPSRIRTLDPGRLPSFAFGSCRTTGSHDAEGVAEHGVDALRSLGVALRDDPGAGWPDLLLLLGDQVYADTTPNPQLKEFMRSRRSLKEPPYEEIKDYPEYDELYRLTWAEPVVRWLLSTLPSAMIFDDHDIRDDWNTSWAWRRDIRATSWWQERIVSGLASYWVHQHIGNLSPAQLAREEVYRGVLEHAASGAAGELDLTEALEALATRADAEPETYRWSHTRELGDCLLVVLDSRAARDLQPDHRSMLDPVETRWLDDTLRGGYRHVFVGTSLPFLLPPGLHDFEAIDEAVAQGAYGRPFAHLGEQLRRSVDLEHWAAFNSGFDEVFEMVMDLARGHRGEAPDSITFLSGDVHNSYFAEVSDVGQYGARSRVTQAVCSPIRNPMPRGVRVMMSMLARSLVRPMRWLRARSERAPDPAYPWTVTEGPWFDNNVALCRVLPTGLELTWVTGMVEGTDHDHPWLRVVSTVRLDPPG
ncbi:alkaline phosphatase family protein [Phycicoccus endophyticus]|uniref:Alkaline phosphatase family protein n=1 Tax=Phycicoccus endophyticus TaxID=1690220 RepID=A0A7G9R254_9MICO|nr:alkaline phosphatase D family protein [Phycicoccus endophyticus]NHI19669.1 alkaline phosphatase family protein [Phycicoccus endophyticus]QNN49679.1 alkaline phosphatase family protein [Phycicoccus endophyticus]GGL34024.1 metallophosphatase [Phycicoccus endophyticus]